MEYLSRCIGIFSEPRKTFQSFPEKPTIIDWLIPLALLLIVSIAAAYITGPITIKHAMDRQYEMIENSTNMTDAQKNEYLDELDNADPYQYLASKAIAAVILTSLLHAGLLMLITSLILGGTGSFLQLWHMFSWVMLIKIAELIVSSVIILYTGNAMVELGLSLILPGSMSNSLFYFLLMQFSIFAIWRVILYGMGISIIFGTEKNKTLLTLFIAWFFFALIAATISAKLGLTFV